MTREGAGMPLWAWGITVIAIGMAGIAAGWAWSRESPGSDPVRWHAKTLLKDKGNETS